MLNNTNLSYSSKDGSFVFYDPTNNHSNNTNNQDILLALTSKETDRENIGIEKDDLILTLVVSDRTRANVFLAMH